jgi:hypothetical protein
MDIWNSNKKKELQMIKECVSLILKQKERLLTSNKMNELEFHIKMEELFPSFIKNYGAIYKMVVKSNDLTLLYSMINNMNDVCNGDKKFEDVRSNFGSILTDKYVPPELQTATAATKNKTDKHKP